jgi:hypothetical protein
MAGPTPALSVRTIPYPVAAYIPAGRRFLMAQDKKNTAPDASADDSLLNLKFAQAEADLAQKTGGLGPTTNEYVTSDEDDEITRAEGPVDSQGQRRGVTDPTDEGSTAGSHS